MENFLAFGIGVLIGAAVLIYWQLLGVVFALRRIEIIIQTQSFAKTTPAAPWKGELYRSLRTGQRRGVSDLDKNEVLNNPPPYASAYVRP